MPTTPLDERGVRYWEIRQGRIQSNSVALWNKEVKDMSHGVHEGASVRVLYKNGWGFAYSEEGNLKSIMKQALSIAKIIDKKTKVRREIASQKRTKASKAVPMKTDFHGIGFEEKKKLLLEMAKSALSDKRITNASTNYLDITKETRFTNSEGSEIRQRLNYCYGGASVTAKRGLKIEQYSRRVGAQAGYEVTKEFHAATEKAKEKAIALLDAKVPKGGRTKVVCDGVLTDVFIHEALGHAAEADHIIQKASCLDGRLGTRIAPDHVTVIDDGTIPKMWGSYFYDDEGIKASKTTLINKGRLQTFLNSRETAAALRQKLTGNGRAGGISQIPLVRMSNTYIKKHDWKTEEMFKEMKNGYYLKGSSGGQVDTAVGSFQFSAQEGYLIERGEIKTLLKNISLAGNTLELLGNITAISDRYQAGFPGHCGKSGQMVPVIGHCPSILIEDALVGGK
ncbi:TldD/PmbA family protein [Candidatus Woesearchaeota archaeon]|nr:TldD/PmbA family protein [Candidatus Woesearchaeota archaeon]